MAFLFVLMGVGCLFTSVWAVAGGHPWLAGFAAIGLLACVYMDVVW